MTNSDKKPFFSADRPIISKEEDVLNRSSFAESLATAIRNWREKDSLVIALYGPWGSGKSSIKNMVLESLRERKETCPTIVEFNPWQWAGHDQLTAAFFQEIGKVLGRIDTNGKGKERAAKWREYGIYLTLGASLAKSFKIVLPLLGIPGLEIVELLGKGLKEAGEVSKDGAEGLFAQSETNNSLNELKQEISELMAELERPILVVIDDVDRLSTKEITLLFQLIKANADFPNIIYFLLFQRDIVEKSLETIAPITGREFLEKIVQIGFDIPQIERIHLEKILFDRLEELLTHSGTQHQFNKTRWENIFIPGLSPYFKTLRDVYRFINTFSFQVSLFLNEKTFEVNFIDLVALEVLRVFEPEVYHRLYRIRPILTRQIYSGSGEKDTNDLIKQECEFIINQATEENRPQVKEILKELFPTIEWVFGGANYGPDFEECWFRELRVCHPNVFDRYFHLTIPEGDISKADLDRILALVGNREGLVAEFKSLNERGLLGVVLNRLEAYKEEIELEHAIPFVTAIFDIGDILPDEEIGFLGIGPEAHATRIIHWYLKKESDIKRRGEILKKAMKASTGLYLPVLKTFIEDNKQERKKDRESFLVDEDDLKELKGICIEKIRKAAKSGQLQKHSKMAQLLYRWRKWASPEETRKWVEELVETTPGLLSFLVAFLQKNKISGQGDYGYRINYYMKLKNIEDFISADTLKSKIEQISDNDLTDQEQMAISAFHEMLKRREEGKSDDEW